MQYRYSESREKSTKRKMFFKVKGDMGHELIEVNVTATGKEREKIIEKAEEAIDGFFEKVKTMLENEGSEEPSIDVAKDAKK